MERGDRSIGLLIGITACDMRCARKWPNGKTSHVNIFWNYEGFEVNMVGLKLSLIKNLIICSCFYNNAVFLIWLNFLRCMYTYYLICAK